MCALSIVLFTHVYVFIDFLIPQWIFFFLLVGMVGIIHFFFSVSKKIKASGFDVVFGNIRQSTRFFEEGIKKVKKRVII